ncbi:class I SAM-dependent methyltransferase [Alicyclobacillus fastidiosus]|uniref:Class I SAM-dependent methyltransferase n=1 Tax=Alicyclobacillus fastidiosus TaxID=392011 RepID=A0ABV5AGK9_9BACL|nr:class I SAM-dependent methyltransferase [Alicyclobacillus fastidiosus]WEH07972.1 class I SAM-dependent methyltransferase [Alicyclobacillus fastidiosus]
MTVSMSPDEIRKNYDKIADFYEHGRSKTIGLNHVNQFLSFLPHHSNHLNPPSVLDIGCGTGIPLTRHLVSYGARVTGLDISAKMLEKARQIIPEVTFIRSDITSCMINSNFDGVLAWDSLFHIPLEKQINTLKKVIRLLRPNGVALFTTGGQHGELVSEMFGQKFYYSSLSKRQYEATLAEENCQVLYNEIDDPSGHGHRVICCKKNGVTQGNKTT